MIFLLCLYLKLTTGRRCAYAYLTDGKKKKMEACKYILEYEYGYFQASNLVSFDMYGKPQCRPKSIRGGVLFPL